MSHVHFNTAHIDGIFRDKEVFFYGSSARILVSVLGWSLGAHDDKSYLGASFILPAHNFFCWSAKIVRAGYALSIQCEDDSYLYRLK